LAQARRENAALRQEKLIREESLGRQLQKLQQENATLHEERSRERCLEASLKMAQQENVFLSEEKLANDERHRRDVVELEGMLEPVMAENSQLRTALQAAEARLEATSVAEPDIEQSCDIDQLLRNARRLEAEGARSLVESQPRIEEFPLSCSAFCSSHIELQPQIEELSPACSTSCSSRMQSQPRSEESPPISNQTDAQPESRQEFLLGREQTESRLEHEDCPLTSRSRRESEPEIEDMPLTVRSRRESEPDIEQSCDIDRLLGNQRWVPESARSRRETEPDIEQSCDIDRALQYLPLGD